MASAADRRMFWGTAGLVVVLDIFTKVLAEARLLRSSGVEVLGDWIQLRLVYNPGAAFGLNVGPYSRWIFLGIALLAVVVLYRMSERSPGGDLVRQLALGAVTGGAFGNLVDRLRNPQGVVDFLDVGFGTLRWPTFNVADIAVSCGALLLAISLWREDARRADEAATSQSITPV
ncbi:MAG TPA: signal peptidase II [Gemmatimonadales bacterium]|nr:signal peptidase II [Gemmatimonadales bacterium]